MTHPKPHKPWSEIVEGIFFCHLVIKSPNGEVLLSSETYYSRSNARRAAKRLEETLGICLKKEPR